MVKRIFTLAMAMFVASSACFATNWSKVAKKKAKEDKKEGWVAPPGSLPLEIQNERYFEMKAQKDENGFDKFIEGKGISVGQNYDAAKMQAINLAKIELAGNIATDVAGNITSNAGNNQLDPEDAASTVETVMGAKALIAQSIGRIIVASEMIRVLPNKNKEVSVVILYNAEMAKAAAKKAIKEEMEKKGDKLVEQLDKMLGF